MAIDYTKRPARPSTPPPPAQGAPPAGPPRPAPQPSGPVRLTKSAPSVSLTKSGQASGLMRVNLNWNARPTGAPTGGFLQRMAGAQAGIDLDLGCLFEYTDGSLGVVQALGNAFKDSAWGEPVCWLDGDDRSGSNSAGENLFVNLAHLSRIRRILVFAFIYQGVPNWAAADGVVTLFPAHGTPLEVRLDEPGANNGMCAIAMLENTGGELSVRREVRYFSGHQQLDHAYGWGLRWTAGRK